MVSIISWPYVKVLKGCAPSHIVDTLTQKLPHILTEQRVSKGSVVFRVGQEAKCCYFLKHGRLELLKPCPLRSKTNQKMPDPIGYLTSKYKLELQVAQRLSLQLFSQGLNRYLPFAQVDTVGTDVGISTLYAKMPQNCLGLATQDTILWVVTAKQFDETLKECETARRNWMVSLFLRHFPKEIAPELQEPIGRLVAGAVSVYPHRGSHFCSEKTPVDGFYLLLSGSCQIHKTAQIHIADSRATEQKKEFEFILAELPEGALVGHFQSLLSIPERQFSLVAQSFETALAKFDSALLNRLFSDSVRAQKELTLSAKCLMLSLQESFISRKNKVDSTIQLSRLKQPVKVESNVSALVTPYQQLEVFTEKGIYFRDSFQKLRGFESQCPTKNDRGHISRRQVNASPPTNTVPIQKPSTGTMDTLIDVIGLKLKMGQNIPQSARTAVPKNHFRPRSKHPSLTKDEGVFRKVMIKTGPHEPKAAHPRSNQAEPLLHPHFDEAVLSCMYRRSFSVRRAIVQGNNQDVIKEALQQTISNLRDSWVVPSKAQLPTSVRGVANIQKMLRDTKIVLSPTRIQRSSSVAIGRSSPRVVLLNHMMKPVAY